MRDITKYSVALASANSAVIAPPELDSSLTKRFLSKVDRSGDCWIWTAFSDRHGYGQFSFRGNMRLAHRSSYIIFRGEIPDGMFVCHKCDNPACVNPDHLFLGTPQDNMDDMTRKGRHRSPRGEGHGRAKLTSAQVVEIRKSHVLGSTRLLAVEFGVSRGSVRKIISGDTWRTT